MTSPQHHTKASSAMPAGAYIRCIARRLAWRLWWLPAAACALITIGAAADWRVSVVGLMLLMTIYPAVMSIAVMSYALKPETVSRTHIDHIEITPSAITLYTESAPVATVTPDKVRALSFKSAYIELVTGPRPDDIILIPRSMLTAESEAVIQTAYSPSQTL